MDETVNIIVQEDGSRAVAANINAVADASDKAGDSQTALMRILAQVNQSMNGLNTSIDKLNQTMSGQVSAVSKVVQAQQSATKTAQDNAKAVDQLSESEAQAVARIKDMVAASTAQTAASDAAATAAKAQATALEGAAAAAASNATAQQASASGYAAAAAAQTRQMLQLEALEDAMGGNIKTMEQWRDLEGQVVAAYANGTLSAGQYEKMIGQLDSQLGKVSGSITKEQAAIQKLTSAYAPQDAALKKIAADEALLTDLRNKGVISMADYEKLMTGIAGKRAVYDDVASGAAKAGAALKETGTISGGVAREYGIMMGEIARGNFTRLEGSAITLGNRLGILQKLFTPIGLGIAAVTAATIAMAAAFISGYEASVKLNNALIIYGQDAGVTGSQVQTLAASMATVNQNTTQTTQLLEAIISTGRSTSDTLGTVGQAAQNMMRLTGEGVDQVAQSFDKLYDDPIKWADDMDTKFHFLTLDVRDHAQQLQNVGDTYGAAKVIAAAFADETKNKVDQLNASMGTLDKLLDRWKSGAANIVDWAKGIGATPTDMQQFQTAKQAYTDWAARVKELNLDLKDPANNDALAYGTKLWNQMYAAQQKVIQAQDAAKTTEQYNQQRKAVLDAGEGIDSINDKTQKQIKLQQQLTKLAEQYRTLYLLDPNDKRLQGVQFGANGLPTGGGSYASKVEQLNEEANGKPKKGPSADELIKPWLEYEKQLQSLIATIDPTVGAMQKLDDAQTLLNKAVQQGDLTQNQADFYFAQYQAQLKDTLNPAQALTDKLNDQIKSLQQTGKATDDATKAQADAQQLLKQGVIVDDAWIQNQEKKYAEIEKLTAQQQIYQRIQKSVIDQTKSFSDELTVLDKLQAKGPGNGGISKEQADQYLVKQNPDLFQGTQKALEVQLDQYKQYYAEIDALRNKQQISDTDAAIMTARVNSMALTARLSATQSFLGTVEQLQTSSNKKVAAIGKAAAIAQATINTYTGATAAYQSAAAIPMVGWILAPIAAAAAVIAGIEQVQKIRSTTPGYMTGGYTGDMATTAVAGLVHGQEWVSNAQTTNKYRPQLEAMHDGTYDAKYANSKDQPVVINKPADNYKFLMVDDQRDIGSYMSGPAGEKIVVTHVRRNGGTNK